MLSVLVYLVKGTDHKASTRRCSERSNLNAFVLIVYRKETVSFSPQKFVHTHTAVVI
jgi:hypothetical protein